MYIEHLLLSRLIVTLFLSLLPSLLAHPQIGLQKLNLIWFNTPGKLLILMRMVYMFTYADFIFLLAKTQNIRETRDRNEK